MNILEAFATIFTSIWGALTSPSTMMALACIVMIAGFLMLLLGVVVPHYGRKEMWQRLSFILGGPLVFITGMAIAIWAGTSSPDGLTWN